jgi:hypothetical protein
LARGVYGTSREGKREGGLIMCAELASVEPRRVREG